MTNEQQDLAWKCLPKEVRSEIKSIYTAHTKRQVVSSQDILLDELFGKDNLTLDTEPEEMLMVERKQVQEYHLRYKHLCNDDGIAKGICHAIKHFFGDKCLPDKEPSFEAFLDNMHNKELEITEKQPSVQDIPKFKYNIDDLVTYKGKVKKVINRECGGGIIKYMVSLINGQSPLWFNESDLKPYTEPMFKVGDIVTNKYNGPAIYEVAAVHSNSWGFTYSLKGSNSKYHENHLSLYTKETQKEQSKTIDKCKYVVGLSIFVGKEGKIGKLANNMILTFETKSKADYVAKQISNFIKNNCIDE